MAHTSRIASMSVSVPPPTLMDSMSTAGRLRSLVQAPKPEIKINFDNPKKCYTTLDRLEGTVVITAPLDTPFADVHIEFVGTSRTYVERLTTATAATGRSEAFHQFLKLLQPDTDQYYPTECVLKAGVTYEFPFIFAVPQQLLPRCCSHTIHSSAARDAHLRLPPTFGDKGLAGALEDGAPDMASVRYGVFAKVTEIKVKGDDAWRSTIASKARRIRVLPVIETQPPLDVHNEDGDYTMRKERTIRKGMLKGKAGTLVMEAAQPQALQVQSYDNPDARTNSMATIMLRYDPIDENSAPPKLGNLSSKLKVTTYFASTARHNIPTRATSLTDMTQGIHTDQLNLSARCMTNVEWAKHGPSQTAAMTRRDSATSLHSSWSGGIPAPSETYKGKAFYTARLVVPIQLPTSRAFPPTFHSCLISRSYSLRLDLGVSSTGLGPSTELKVPIQISTEGLVGDELERRGSVGSVDGGNGAEIDVEDAADLFTYFEPRSTRPPTGGFLHRSRLGSQAPIVEEPVVDEDAPPGYTPPTGRVMNTRVLSSRGRFVPAY